MTEHDTRRQDSLRQAMFGRSLRVLRSSMSQEALAPIVGYRSGMAISHIEAGGMMPSLSRAIDIAKFFETTVEAMVGEVSPPVSPTYHAAVIVHTFSGQIIFGQMDEYSLNQVIELLQRIKAEHFGMADQSIQPTEETQEPTEEKAEPKQDA